MSLSLKMAWLLSLLVPPLAIGLAQRLSVLGDRLRPFALTAAAVSTVAGVIPTLLGREVPLRIDTLLGLAPSIWGAELLSAPLIALPPILWMVALATTPRARLDAAGIGRTALATTVATATFLTAHPVLLAASWAATTGIFLGGLRGPAFTVVHRSCARYLWSAAVLFACGLLLSTAEGWIADVGLVLVVVAVLIRKGIFPFHAWIPNAVDEGRIGPTVLFSAPQVGAYAAAVLVVPRAGPELLGGIALLSVLTAVYGAALALIQRDARRAVGYLFVSQSALVLAGLDSRSEAALTGSLVIWISSALAFTGIGRAILAIEARRGRLDLRTHHGGYDQMPLLGAGFLVLGLACTGFPGTLGFVGQEILLEGVVHEFPAAALVVVLTSALTGLAVMRMYLSLFCGARTMGPRLTLRRREGLAIGALAAILIIAGLFPDSIVASRQRAAAAVTVARESPRPQPSPGRSVEAHGPSWLKRPPVVLHRNPPGDGP